MMVRGRKLVRVAFYSLLHSWQHSLRGNCRSIGAVIPWGTRETAQCGQVRVLSAALKGCEL